MKAKILKFYSTTCPPCKALTPITKEIAKENPDIEFVGVDIKEEPNIAQQFNVKSVPTLVFLKNDIEIDRLVGLQSKKEIEERAFLLLE